MSVTVSGSMAIPQDAIVGTGGVNISFGGQHTIYEHQVICTMNPVDFNYSTNPSAYGSASSGEAIVDLIASGTLTPYMTTIGLYNENSQLVAVAKLAKPIKRLLDADQSIIIRFDA